MKRYVRSDSSVLPEGTLPREKSGWKRTIVNKAQAWEFECADYLIIIKPKGNRFVWDLLYADGKYICSGGACKSFAIASEMAEKTVRSELQKSVRHATGW